ncbi:hypothetical protein [Actinomadura sp. 9N407]|uniref:hypothetical protein n=1 Tax=Actinomadura sp. 9N407 TaxID=3375154 RepID=UPI0037AC77BE
MPERNRFSKGLFSWMGFECAVVEYRGTGRSTGQSKWTFGQLVKYAIDGAPSFNSKPLRLAIYSGMGVPFLPDYYLYFASPPAPLVALFPPDRIDAAMFAITAAKWRRSSPGCGRRVPYG